MDSRLYEELCRIYLAEQFGVSVEAITSRLIESPQRAGEPKVTHQIDHYWETGSDAVLYVNIANAKWRTSEKADQGEVVQVHAVKEMVRAHKALLITSTEFTSGARGVAAQYGIGLHIVRPSFEHASVPLGDRASMRAAIARLADRPYSFDVIHRGLEIAERPAPIDPVSRPTPAYTSEHTHRAGPGPGSTDRSLGGVGGPGCGGLITRDGGGFSRGGGGGFTRR